MLVDGDIVLRPIKLRDQRVWREVNRRNRDWLRPWEATIPPPAPGGPIAHRPTYRQMVRHLRAEANAGRMLPFVIEYQGRLVGQLTVAGITWGSMCSGHVGYWVDQSVAGRGVMPTSVALVVDHCFRAVGLHRIEVCIRPENGPSRRVVEKLGFREEGLRPRYLHIDGAWRDHLVFALTAEEVPEGLLARWRRSRSEDAARNQSSTTTNQSSATTNQSSATTNQSSATTNQSSATTNQSSTARNQQSAPWDRQNTPGNPQ